MTGAELFDVLKTGFGVTDDKDLMITFDSEKPISATIFGLQIPISRAIYLASK